MTVRKQPDGQWLCDVYIDGRGSKRVRKKFTTRGEALAFENYQLEQVKEKPWLADKEDNRRLSELIELWYKLHGCSLNDKKGRLGKLNIICNGLGDPIASQITAKDWAHYRDRRLTGQIANGYKTSEKSLKVSIGTVNCEHAFLRAVFNELTRLGEVNYPNPLKNIREFDEPEKEMSWLTDDEVKRLMGACRGHGNPELTLIVKICLSTGARWSEAANLKKSQLSPNKITFVNTKGKKNAERAAKTTWERIQRGAASFSIQLAKGRADLFPELPVRVNGFKSQIDEADWIITTVTNSISDSGFTTSLELEVKISDLEMG